MSLNAYNEQAKFKVILLQLPASLQLQFHLANALAQAHKTFVDLNLAVMTSQQERILETILKKMNSDIDSVESRAVSGKDTSLDFMLEAYFRSSKRCLLYRDCPARNQCDAFLQIAELTRCSVLPIYF
jgi:hypothetical protein